MTQQCRINQAVPFTRPGRSCGTAAPTRASSCAARPAVTGGGDRPFLTTRLQVRAAPAGLKDATLTNASAPHLCAARERPGSPGPGPAPPPAPRDGVRHTMPAPLPRPS